MGNSLQADGWGSDRTAPGSDGLNKPRFHSAEEKKNKVEKMSNRPKSPDSNNTWFLLPVNKNEALMEQGGQKNQHLAWRGWGKGPAPFVTSQWTN